MPSSTFKISINGVEYKVDPASDPSFYNPTTSLVDFIRCKTPYTATKKACAEGGCGACTVACTMVDNATGQIVTRPINSCLALLWSLDGAAISTNEAEGSSTTGYSDVQKALAENNGFQCSMCSSGKVMLVSSYLKENPNATKEDLQGILDGSLCRCAAYVGIVKTFQQFGSDSGENNSKPKCMKENCCQKKNRIGAKGLDVEDCDQPLSWDERDTETVKKNLASSKKQSNNKIRQFASAEEQEEERQDKTLPPSYHQAVKQQQKKDSLVSYTPVVPDVWVDIDSLSALSAAYNQFKDRKVHIIKNATSFGIYHEYRQGKYDVFLHLTDNIPEMQGCEMTAYNAKFGANSTVKDMIEFLQAHSGDAGAQLIFPVLAKHLGRIAGYAIRNRATVGGNLALCHRHSTEGDSFPSDLAICMVGSNAQLVIYDIPTQAQSIVNVSDYLATGNPYNPDTTIILQILVPILPPSVRVVFRTYKIAIRQVMDHAIVNAAFNAQVDENGKIVKSTIAIGGCFPAPTRVTAVEQILSNGADPSSPSVLQSACAALAQAITAGIDPTEGRVVYRIQTAQNYLYKFFLALRGDNLPADLQAAALPWMERNKVVTTFSESYGKPNPDYVPVGLPIVKQNGLTLASGESRFTADIAIPNQCLFSAPVFTTQANAPITSIDKTAGAAVPGYVAYFDENDAPSNKVLAGPKQLFCGNFSNYASQLAGVVVAESQEAARLAAKMVQQSIQYGPLKGPILLTVDDCVTAKSYFNPDKPDATLKQGDAASAMKASGVQVVSGTVAVGSQYHAHLENHVAQVTPVEDVYKVECASQCATSVQQQMAETLQIKASSVQVSTRRCGGAFGSKSTAPTILVGMQSIAAMKLRRAIKMEYTMQEGMAALGARSPYRFDYQVGVDTKTGKIVAMTGTVYVATGWQMDDCAFEGDVALPSLDNSYCIPNCDLSFRFLRSNTPPNTSVRGPGWLSATFLCEQVMNNVANKLSISPYQFRMNNLQKTGDKTFSNMIIQSDGLDKCLQPLQAEYATAAAAVKQFNANNRLVKRGIALNPTRFPILWANISYQTIVTIYSDASIAIQTGGTEVGQGIFQKLIQCCAYALQIPNAEAELINIKILPTNTGYVNIPNNTGGSVTSELCCASLMATCAELNQRLLPYRQEGKSWQDTIAAATAAGVDLSARGSGVPGNAAAGFRYNTWGSCLCIVEVDGLTGQWEIKEASLRFDVGTSLNPKIDLNQVEGGWSFGLGWVSSELVTYDPKTGMPLDNTTWRYKPVSSFELPEKFNVTLLPNAHNKVGVLSSKACGEPPCALAMTFVTAVEDAVNQVRAEVGQKTGFSFTSLPVTVDKIAAGCGITTAALPLS